MNYTTKLGIYFQTTPKFHRKKRGGLTKNYYFWDIMQRCILTILAVLFCFTLSARNSAPGVRTEWGVVAGVNYPVAKFSMGQSAASLKPRTGFTAGIHMGLRIVGIFGIQPEILYSYNKIELNDNAKKFSTQIRCNTIQIPLLLSLKFGLFRINAGPVFTVMDNPTYLDSKEEKVMFGRIHPTIGYAAGVSLALFNRLLIDARVASGLKAMENCLSYSSSHSEYIKTTMFNAQLKVGILF